MSPVITLFVVAFAIEVNDERLISADNRTATSHHFGQKEHIPPRIGDTSFSLTLREF